MSFLFFLFLSLVIQGSNPILSALNLLPFAACVVLCAMSWRFLYVSPLWMIVSLLIIAWLLMNWWRGIADPYIEDGLATRQLFNISMTFMILIGGSFLYRNKLCTFEDIIRTCIYGASFFALSKILLVLLVFFHVISFKDFLEIMGKLGVQFVHDKISGIEINRVQFTIDIIMPFSFLIFLFYQNREKEPKKIYDFYAIMMLMNSVISFSRVVLACAALAFFAYIFIYRRGWRTVVALLGAVAIYAFFFDAVNMAIYQRFLSNAVSVSDETRVMQFHALMDKFHQSPLLGTGLGGYTWKQIRSFASMYSYEMQLVQLLMQVGLLGMAFLGTLIIGMILLILRHNTLPDALILNGALLLFIMTGFTNPYLVGRISGVLLLLFWLAGAGRQKVAKASTDLAVNTPRYC